MISECLGVNQNGNLTIGGADTVELAEKYGTPLYVYDENLIRKTCREFKASIDEFYGGNGLVLYASKAFSCKEMYRIIQSEGLGCDVVSGGELYTALSAGFNAKNIFFHGNNKTPDEIRFALKSGVGRIVADNMTELSNIQNIAESLGIIADIVLRIKPGIDAHTHDYIRTGQIDSKFGFALENGESVEATEKALSYKNIKLHGFHCHIASQVCETKPFMEAAEVMLSFMYAIRERFGVTLSELNLGGGFGIKYLETDEQIPFNEYMKNTSAALKKQAETLNFPVPRIFIEPGRSIVAPAGITLYKVGNVKTIENIRTYVAIDGGMSDNPRYALYNADYTVEIANKADKPKDFVATVAGKCCESGDLIQENAPMQTPDVGDVLAVLSTGAYNYSMASNYNRIPRPAAVMINNGEDRLIIKRETFEDIIKNDL